MDLISLFNLMKEAHIPIWAFFLFILFEYWMGINSFKANSSLQLVLIFFKAFIEAVVRGLIGKFFKQNQ